ncbi:uncharacterized protein LOC104657534 [Rhinopithecus roxellana]|uniref:uncharacterized protein LOC104657534 n=1 Tax=Rhinopithecus roxellana TaxID=61622 RepID=UPI0012377DCC|nr:uncharacterized protein LOC104657534 [Rhinopithecus roxellana]
MAFAPNYPLLDSAISRARHSKKQNIYQQGGDLSTSCAGAGGSALRLQRWSGRTSWRQRLQQGERIRLPGGRGRLALRSGAPEPPARAPRGEARRGAQAAAATATYSRQWWRRRRRPRAGITEVTCTGNQFAEIIQSTILEVEEKEVPALTRGGWLFLESLWTHLPSFL